MFHRGDPADAVHWITKGRFVARIVTPLGDTVALRVQGPGDAFGKLALLEEGGTRSATVAALEPAETRSLTRRDFNALCRRHPGAYRVLVEGLAQQVRSLSEMLVDALYVPAELRVLRRLAEMAAGYADGEEATVIPLTQEEIAGLAGTSRATVNRALREAERRGVLELRRGRTVVSDIEALRRNASPRGYHPARPGG